MENTIKDALLKNAPALFGTAIGENLIQFQKTKKEFAGDSTLMLFPMIKVAGKSPQELGTAIGTFLRDELRLVSDFNQIGGFLNLVFPETHWLSVLHGIDDDAHFGLHTPDSKPAIMVEYSSPNTNKPRCFGLKPMARSTPYSLVRSRTFMAMVLPTIMVMISKMTIDTMSIAVNTPAYMEMKPRLKARSLSVSVW